MKKSFIPLYRHLPVTIILFTLSSCILEKEKIEASFDMVHRKYDGDSYNAHSVDKGLLGLNLAYLLIYGSEGADDIPSSNNRQHTVPYGFAGQVSIPGPVSKDYSTVAAIKDNSPIKNKAASSKSTGNISLLTGLEFVQKNSNDGGDKLNLVYMQVPAIGIYSYRLDAGGKIFGGLGPYVACGIGGKIKSTNYSAKAFDKNNGFKRFDAGLSFTAGYFFSKGMSVRLGYDLGLLDIDRINADFTKNRLISLNFAYPIKLLAKK